MPFLRACASIIPDVYPERLRKVVVYPLPGWAKTLIGLVKKLLDPVTRDKIVLLRGDDSRDAPCPAGLVKHVAHGQLPPHARARHAALLPAAAPAAATAPPPAPPAPAPRPEPAAPPPEPAIEEATPAAAAAAAARPAPGDDHPDDVAWLDDLPAPPRRDSEDGAPVWVPANAAEFHAATVVSRGAATVAVRLVEDGSVRVVAPDALLPRDVP